VAFFRQTLQISIGIPTDSCEFPIGEVIGAQNSNFASEFTPNGSFSQKLRIFGRKFFGEEKFRQFFNSPFLWGGAIALSPYPLPEYLGMEFSWTILDLADKRSWPLP